MTRVTFQGGKVVLRDGQVGTEEACCCGEECEGPCDSRDDCGEGCHCCDGECQDEPCDCDSKDDCEIDEACCDGKCIPPPFCNETRWYKICIRLVNPVPGISCSCHVNIGDLFLCSPQVLTRSQPYNAFCALEVSAEVGADCELQNLVITRSTGGFCDDDVPEFIELTEITEAECESTFVPD